MQSSRSFSQAIGTWARLAALLGASLTTARAASAAEDLPQPDLTADARPPRLEPVNVLPEAISARVNDGRATGTTWAGYDGAKRAPLLTATAEARIVGRLVVVAGVGYTADIPGAPAMRPLVGVRAQLL